MDCPLCHRDVWTSDDFSRRWSVCEHCRDRYEREMTEAEGAGKGISKQIDWSYYPAFRADPQNKNRHYLSFYDWATLISIQEKGRQGISEEELSLLKSGYKNTIEYINRNHSLTYNERAVKARNTIRKVNFD